jgi:PPOX class probable F420-dependent enzyme
MTAMKIDNAQKIERGLARFEELAAADRHLGVLVTRHLDGTPQVSVVNAGIVDHPDSAVPVVALVGRRGAKLANLRRDPTATLVVRAGWEWIAVAGPVTLIGPDDPYPGIDAERLRQLLRDVFHAAGGRHDDLAVYDEVMAAERRCAVLITPQRFTTNPTGSEHKDPAP